MTHPPLTPFLAQRSFFREGWGVVYFEVPRGKNFMRPPSFIRPPPREGYFQGWGGVYKIWPRIKVRDGETTIKIKFSLLRGGGLGGREENRPKTLVLVGNATTIKY